MVYPDEAGELVDLNFRILSSHSEDAAICECDAFVKGMLAFENGMLAFTKRMLDVHSLPELHAKMRTVIERTYPGRSSWRAMFQAMCEAMCLAMFQAILNSNLEPGDLRSALVKLTHLVIAHQFICSRMPF